LQVADGVFFEHVAARVTVETSTSRLIHANEMCRLMQCGMQGCIGSKIKRGTDEAGLAVTPVGSRDRLTGCHVSNLESIGFEQRGQSGTQ